MNAQQVSTEILNQLGGRQFIAMTGSKNFQYGNTENGSPFLRMRLSKNKTRANFLQITLDPSDTYTVQFMYIAVGKSLKVETVLENSGIYCDQLQDIFEETTGFYTTLNAR